MIDDNLDDLIHTVKYLSNKYTLANSRDEVNMNKVINILTKLKEMKYESCCDI